MPIKQLFIDALTSLPEIATLDEVADEVSIVTAICLGTEEVDQGKTILHDELRTLVRSWANH